MLIINNYQLNLIKKVLIFFFILTFAKSFNTLKCYEDTNYGSIEETKCGPHKPFCVKAIVYDGTKSHACATKDQCPQVFI